MVEVKTIQKVMKKINHVTAYCVAYANFTHSDDDWFAYCGLHIRITSYRLVTIGMRYAEHAQTKLHHTLDDRCAH